MFLKLTEDYTVDVNSIVYLRKTIANDQEAVSILLDTAPSTSIILKNVSFNEIMKKFSRHVSVGGM